LRLSSFGGYGLALAALALVVFGAYDCYPKIKSSNNASKSGCEIQSKTNLGPWNKIATSAQFRQNVVV